MRSGALSDLNDLIELRILMQKEVNDQQTLPDNYRENVRQYFLANLGTNYESVVVTVNNKVVGSAGICFYQKPPSISGGSGLVGYVTNVYTRVDFRGKGLGTLMMKKVTEICKIRNADKLHLGATVDGIGIYKRVGFKEPRFVNLEFKP